MSLNPWGQLALHIGATPAAIALLGLTLVSFVALVLAAYFTAKDGPRFVLIGAIVTLLATPLLAQTYNCEKGCWWCIECWWAIQQDPTTVEWELQSTFNPFDAPDVLQQYARR